MRFSLRRELTAILLLLGPFSGFASADILNPSFEDYNPLFEPDQWTQVGVGSVNAFAVSSDEWSTDGTYGLKIGSDQNQSWGAWIGVEQVVDLSQVIAIRFDAWIEISAGAGTYLDVFIDNALVWTRSAPAVYPGQVIDASSFFGLHTLKFRFVWGSPDNIGPATVRVDDLRITGPIGVEETSWARIKSLYRD